MNVVLVSFVVVVTLCLIVSVILPLYFLKWKKKESTKSSVGLIMAGAAVLDTVVQLKLIDWTYYSLFYNFSSFQTDANGVFKNNGQLARPSLNEITNCISLPNYDAGRAIWNPQLFFDKNIAVATETQILTKGCAYLSDTNLTRGGFYLSDDGLSIKVGRIKTNADGTHTLEKLVSIAPTTDVSKIPNNWFVIGSPSLSIAEYVYSAPAFFDSFAGPFVWPIKNFTVSTRFDTATINMYSDIYFLIRIPRTFSQYLFSTSDNPAGLAKVSFDMAKLIQTNALKTGWSILSITEAQASMSATTISTNNWYNPKTCLYDSLDGLVKVCEFGLSSKPGVVTILSESASSVWDNGVNNFWIVKSATRRTNTPLASDILDLSLTIGNVGTLSAVAQVPTIVQSTNNSGVTTIVNQVTGVTVTQTTANGIVTTINQNSGRVSTQKTGDVTLSPEQLTAEEPPVSSNESFYEKNKLYIYEAVSVGSTLVLATITGILLWKMNYLKLTIQYPRSTIA